MAAKDFVYQPPSAALDIIHADDDVIVLNKPAGLLSVPGRLDEHKDCLQTRVQAQFPTALTVHRLDMETSGIVIMALNKAAQSSLARQFQERLTQKTYIARVYGHVTEVRGTVEAPLICDWPNRPKQMVDFDNGKPSTTHYKVLNQEAETTLIELTPVTGRSHQLRVHMLHIGHVIVGDRLYATRKALAFSDRLQLHSQSLSFKHPSSDQTMSFESKPTFVST
ncbi:RluA family pseudouridine synthase [Marinicella rhabdoformis]|uniref:RluA family pseudouridine synthase n=1 Tax=Marinicella rhabdoformis TaxID=2580566 RepID=UPI0012AED497|nr:RluA family pseudouridine synthase [Marinicella rhabdoformis]